MLSHSPLHRPLRQRDAFTLIELLVVITIIGILTSIAVAVYSRAQDRSRTTQCLSQLRQIAIGVLNYAGDHDLMLMPLDSETPVKTNWISTLSNGNYCYAPESNSATEPASKSVFRCPSDSKVVVTTQPAPASRSDVAGASVVALQTPDDTGRNRWYHTSYAINGVTSSDLKYPFARDPAANAGGANPHRLSDVPAPTKTALALDGALYLDADSNRVNLRHGNKSQCNMVFFDGHAATLATADIPPDITADSCDYPRFRIDYAQASK